MRYVSTRGNAPELEFADVMLAGLARDGGLYVPEAYPQIPADTIRAFAGRPYAAVAEAVVSPYVDGAIDQATLRRLIDEAYATFGHRAVTPLVQVGDNDWVLELFHGPTLAFKDVAMQLLARLMDHVLGERSQRATIVGATSGDTGGAAIEAFRGREAVDIFILFPDGRVSDVQRRQMTTVGDANVHAIAVDGTFDDCQALVKGLFNNHGFRDRVSLSGVNSINWARILAQVVYYFTSAVALGGPDRPVRYAVPTGNFGDVLAGAVAERMGLPVDRLVIGTNVNDILARTLASGRYETRGVTATTSPSMDIQVSSNFERALFDAHDRDAGAVSRMMAGLGQSGAFTIAEGAIARLRATYAATRISEEEVAASIRRELEVSGYLLDPHTAVGLEAGRAERGDPAVPLVALSTAHPAKFPDAVEAASGSHPALPDFLSDLHKREERFSQLPADADALESFILENGRAGGAS